MTTKEAIQAMLDGKKVRATNWEDGYYVQFSENAGFIDESLAIIDVTIEEKWEIYEEPKQKQTVTIEKWLCSVVENSYFIIEGTKEFMSGRGENVKLLDTYEVEL